MFTGSETMRLTRRQIEDAALRIHKAERSRTQIRHLSLEHPAMDIVDVDAIQRAACVGGPESGRCAGNASTATIAFAGMARSYKTHGHRGGCATCRRGPSPRKR